MQKESSSSSEPGPEVIVNYLLIVMVTLFIAFLVFMVFVKRCCSRQLEGSPPSRIKKQLDSPAINKYLPSKSYAVEKEEEPRRVLDLEGGEESKET